MQRINEKLRRKHAEYESVPGKFVYFAETNRIGEDSFDYLRALVVKRFMFVIVTKPTMLQTLLLQLFMKNLLLFIL